MLDEPPVFNHDRRGRQSTSSMARPPKVALINSIVARYDAISASVFDTYRALVEGETFQVSLFCYRNDFAELASCKVSNINDLIFHPDFLCADILLWHFGITYDLFDAAMIGNGQAVQVVRFHNVTPKRFAPERAHETIDKSLRQAHLLRNVDEIWADSSVNAEEARLLGVDPGLIHEVPLVVEGPPIRRPSDKALEPVTILFVGRFVPSKGVLELLSAIENFRRQCTGVPFRVELAGNIDFSDPDYVREIYSFIEQASLGDLVTMHGEVDDNTLSALYAAAHILAIPSYHEGFCKPVVEALRAGCIPVGYASHNLPHIVNGFGRLVAPGDVQGLNSALRAVIEALPNALRAPQSALMPLDMGPVSLVSLAFGIERYVARFAADRIGNAMRRRLTCLLSPDC